MASAPSDAKAGEARRGGAATALDAALRHPLVSPATVTVAQVREAFRDDHLHAVLVVHGERLLAVVEREDLAHGPGPTTPAREAGRLDGRTVAAGADLEQVRLELVRSGRRRAAVVDGDARLLGLLCLKRSGHGFCSDDDVRSRAAEHPRAVPPVGLEPTLRPF